MSLKTRLKKLEASTAASRTFVIWQKPGVDVEAEKARLRAQGMHDEDTLIVISWMTDDATDESDASGRNLTLGSSDMERRDGCRWTAFDPTRTFLKEGAGAKRRWLLQVSFASLKLLKAHHYLCSCKRSEFARKETLRSASHAPPMLLQPRTFSPELLSFAHCEARPLPTTPAGPFFPSTGTVLRHPHRRHEGKE